MISQKFQNTCSTKISSSAFKINTWNDKIFQTQKFPDIWYVIGLYRIVQMMAGENFVKLQWFFFDKKACHTKFKNCNHLIYHHVRCWNGICISSEGIPQIHIKILECSQWWSIASCKREPANPRDTQAVAVIEQSPSAGELTWWADPRPCMFPG